MSVILAVDIVNGKAVKAYAGIRSNYKPLHINNEDFSNPIKLIRSFQEKINIICELSRCCCPNTNHQLLYKNLLKR